MFLLPSLVVGLLIAKLLGGRPSRILEQPLRLGGLVFGSLAVQVVLFSRLGDQIPAGLVKGLHLASYALLLAFALVNVRRLPLAPTWAGLLLNATAIFANGGRMPASADASAAAGVSPAANGNVSLSAPHLRFLGDVFALPSQLPFANAFSVGDVLIGLGVFAFVMTAAIRQPQLVLPRAARTPASN
jgi:hypothetical protein